MIIINQLGNGDTKASKKFEELLFNIAEELGVKDEDIVVYHDFSNFNIPSRNIHTCESDF